MITSNSTCALGKFTEKALDGLLTMGPQELFSRLYKHIGLLNQENGEFKIPTISHHIWLTKPTNPKEVRAEDIENLKNSIAIIDNLD